MAEIPETIPASQFVADQAPASAPGRAPGQAPESIPADDFVSDEDRFGTVPQQLLGGAEAVAHGFAGPLATLAEKGLTKAGVPGLSPEAQEGRKAALGDVLHGAGEIAGFSAGMFTGAGEARLLELAGEGALKGASRLIPKLAAQPVGWGAKLTTKASAGALRGAVEGALYQGLDETSKYINDPTLSAGSAAASVSLGSLLGAAAGGFLGPITPYWRKESESVVAQGIQDLKNSMGGTVADHAALGPLKTIEESGVGSSLRKMKPNAVEISDIASRNEWPLAEGMLSGSKEIQMAEDTLLSGNQPTIPAVARKELYQKGYDAASSAVDRSISMGASDLSETQVGKEIQGGLTAKLEAEHAPINAAYRAIEPYQQAIPVGDRSAGALSRNLTKLIEEKGLVPGSERYNFVKTFADGIASVTDLQKLKNFRTEVSRSSGPLTKDLAADIAERLKGVETRAIGSFAEDFHIPEVKEKLQGLVKDIAAANKDYSAFKGKLQEFGKLIGKKKVYGPQDFIDFIEEMNPQTLAKRLFNERNTEGLAFFAKHFPDEFATLRSYQRGVLRQEAMKDGVFNARKAIKSVSEMEPEARDLLMTPNERQMVGEAKTYLDSFPQKFNPGGTAHTSSFRSFFENPGGALAIIDNATGAMLANLRDYGIQSFIKAFGAAVPGAEANASKMLPLLAKAASEKETNPGAFKHAVEYLHSVARGERRLDRAAKGILYPAISEGIDDYPDQSRLDRLNRKIDAFSNDQDKYSEVGGDLNHYLPGHDVVLKGLAANAVGYLSSIKPRPTKVSPFDPEIPVSKGQHADFNRALAIAENPLLITRLIHTGRATPKDIGHLNSLFPALSERLKQKSLDELSHHLGKGLHVPQRIRGGLSLLLGHPVDVSTNPLHIQGNQAVFAQSNQQQAQKNQARVGGSVVGMRNIDFSGRARLGAADDDA